MSSNIRSKEGFDSPRELGSFLRPRPKPRRKSRFSGLGTGVKFIAARVKGAVTEKFQKNTSEVTVHPSEPPLLKGVLERRKGSAFERSPQKPKDTEKVHPSTTRHCRRLTFGAGEGGYRSGALSRRDSSHQRRNAFTSEELAVRVAGLSIVDGRTPSPSPTEFFESNPPKGSLTSKASSSPWSPVSDMTPESRYSASPLYRSASSASLYRSASSASLYRSASSASLRSSGKKTPMSRVGSKSNLMLAAPPKLLPGQATVVVDTDDEFTPPPACTLVAPRRSVLPRGGFPENMGAGSMFVPKGIGAGASERSTFLVGSLADIEEEVMVTKAHCRKAVQQLKAAVLSDGDDEVVIPKFADLAAEDKEIAPIAWLGQGSFGRVYRVKTPGGFVAIKHQVLHSDLGREDTKIAREITIGSRLEAPNKVDTLHSEREVRKSSGFTSVHYWIVMEYVSGGSLSSFIKKMDDHPLLEGLAPSDKEEKRAKIALDLTRQLLKTQEYCSARKIVLRDLKPDNVLVNEVPVSVSYPFGIQVKVCDFGGAHYSGTREAVLPSCMPTLPEVDGVPPLDLRPTSAGEMRPPRKQSMCMTVGYFPREAVDGKASTPSGDLWSIGVMLYEIITGEKPFKVANPKAPCSLFQYMKAAKDDAQIEAAIEALGEVSPFAGKVFSSLVCEEEERKTASQLLDIMDEDSYWAA